MADNEMILDDDVRRIAGVRLVPRLGTGANPWDVYYKVIFADGRVQERPLADCACPDAIADFEGRYFASAHRGGLPGSRIFLPVEDTDTESEAVDVDSRGDGSDADDRHLDDIPSDDSSWENIVDSQGRSATSPTVRAAIRAKAAAPDETYRSPSKDDSESGGSTDDGPSSLSSGSYAVANPASATKSDGSATTDSLLLEIAAKGASVASSPSSKRPVRSTAYRGVALRRHAARRNLTLCDDVFADDDDSDAAGFSPGKNMAKLRVKDEVFDAVKQEADDAGQDPWGGQPAPDPWTQPRSSAPANNVGGDAWHHYRPVRSYLVEAADGAGVSASTLHSSKTQKSEKQFGVIGGLFADYFASQKQRGNAVSLPAKHIKIERVSDDDIRRSKAGPARATVSIQRKRRLGQQASTGSKDSAVEVVTLSDDEMPRLPAKKAKKSQQQAIVYVLSSDSEDQVEPKKQP